MKKCLPCGYLREDSTHRGKYKDSDAKECLIHLRKDREARWLSVGKRVLDTQVECAFGMQLGWSVHGAEIASGLIKLLLFRVN